jgi:nitroimidazol reductase NimA-like FMN-containing flavoprotein (pyridoxamine 5'-phosphate oxidase superfamily)
VGTDGPHLTPDERMRAEALLREAPLAFVAVVESAGLKGNARPYVVPMNFAYEPAGARLDAPAEAPDYLGLLFLHTGQGRKTEALAGNPRVCVVVTADESFDRGATPCQDGFAFRSVLLEGRALLLEDESQREEALRSIVAKYDPLAAAHPFAQDALAGTLVYAIIIDALGYKEHPRRSAS